MVGHARSYRVDVLESVPAGMYVIGGRRAFRNPVAIAASCLLASMAMACSPGSEQGVEQPSEQRAEQASTVSVPLSVLTIGDSQTAGAWLDDPATESWPARLDESLCPEATCVTNIAIGGQPIGTTSPTGPPPLLDTLDEQLAEVDEVTTAVVLIGQLDLVSTDDIDQILSWYGELEQRLTAFGTDDVYFATLLPFDTEAHPNPDWIPQFEARRSAINAGLRAEWGPQGQVIELDSALTEPGSDEFRPELSTKDGNHLSAEGSLIVAAEVESHLRLSMSLDE
jgi:lysophospholipase L1-like esterase